MILLTGAAGFMGLHFLTLLIERKQSAQVIVIDQLTYAASTEQFYKTITDHDIIFYHGDIADHDLVKSIFHRHHITQVINFAAESHVDNSIQDLAPFVHSNIVGTINLLQHASQSRIEKFLQISTDEVFGEISAPDRFCESSPVRPRNPYSASKASAEHFAWAFHNTFDLPVIVVNCSNNYGPFQHCEKFIPKTIINLLQDRPVTIYGTGQQIRDWIYVTDCVQAIACVLDRGQLGERYCIGSNNQISNLDLVTQIQLCLGKTGDMIEFVKDRPGHDQRYATDSTKLKNLGWTSNWSLDHGIEATAAWYQQYLASQSQSGEIGVPERTS